jgi:hypothetical protein
MAVKLEEKSHMLAAEEAEVTNCVSNLIHAFTNGLNVFKRLREKRRKRKARKETQPIDAASRDEAQLSKSLKRGPQELAEKYDACYSQTGLSFAKGDGKLHLELNEIRVIVLNILNSNRPRLSGRNTHEVEYRPRCHHCKLLEP